MYYSQFLILFALVFISGVFSACETALISVPPSKVNELVSKKTKNSQYLKKIKQNPHKLLITVLIGNNIANIGASAYAAYVFTNIFGSSGVGIATGVMTFFILVFGEITPKSLAHQHAVLFSLILSPFIYFLQFMFFPLVWFFNLIVMLVTKITGDKKMVTVTEGELIAMLKISAREGAIEKQEREFIENVLEFNDIEVGEIMTPRVSIDAMDSEMTIQEAVDFVVKHSHTRIPVYKKTIDNIIGIITVKELLRYFDEYSSNKKLKTLKLAVPLEVPFSKKIDKLFREFQRRHLHMAIVIDEHGGTAGLITLEDLLEEIVGEITDEFDIPELPIEIIDKKNIIVSGSTLLEDINDFFKMKFGQNERDTINTFLTEFLHRFPREGETLDFPGIRVKILKMKSRVIAKAQVTKTKTKTPRS